MKQLKYKCLLMLMSALFSVGAWGTSIENVQDEDLLLFEYDEENHTAMVTGISESAMELENLVLTIPATVTYEAVTYTVNAIGDFAFMDAANLVSVAPFLNLLIYVCFADIMQHQQHHRR